MEPTRKLHPGIVALIIIVLVGIVVTATIVINARKDEPSNTTQTTSESTTTESTNTEDAVTSTTYEDGTYSATGSYISPGGRESVELTVTLKDGIITSTSLATNATDDEAQEYQDAFAGSYKELVVGKNIDRVSLSRVAGSSLTSNGFNDALDTIKTDAKA